MGSGKHAQAEQGDCFATQLNRLPIDCMNPDWLLVLELGALTALEATDTLVDALPSACSVACNELIDELIRETASCADVSCCS